MGVIDEILKNKEDILIGFLSIIEGKETKTRVSLDGVKFRVGKTTVKVEGAIELSIVPGKKK
jgi:hypothetical protein